MSGVLRALPVELPADIVNTPKNTVATVKSIAAMMTTTNRSIVRLPEQFLPAPHRILARGFRAPLTAKTVCRSAHTKPLDADFKGLICCVAIARGAKIDAGAHLPTQQCLCDTQDACGSAQ